ncbi:protein DETOXIFICATION 14-like [Pistacia vera]|uniref:protein DETOXIFICATION 14-like n=1 Tax=Pistacia vera TaxID=55513 RepID=UPI001262DDC1|nr:protein DETOXIFICATION 14-like [Pistacia vera]
MDKGLLDEKGEEERREEVSSVGNGRNMGAGEYVEEVKRLSCIAGPMVAVYLSQDFLQVISVVMVGHLGKLSLSSTAVAISFCAVTGFSLLFGMSTAMETLCGQLFNQSEKRKIQTLYTDMFSLILVCFPVSLLWINMGKLLILMGQDPLISTESGKFTVWLVPALFGYAALQPLVRYFQVQSLITPLLMSSCVTICFHIFISWALILEFELNNIGAALAIGMSFWLNVLLLGLYMMYSSSCEKTRVPVSMELFRGLGEFFRLAIPSAFMVCLEWWAFEFLTLLSGLLPNPKLETSVLSVCLTTITTLFTVSDGFGIAGSTRVSNALGAGNPQAARVAVRTAVFLTVLETVIVSSILYASRHVFGYLFSNDKEVVDYVTKMAPLICLCVMLNGFQAVLSGIARACGWQDLGAYVNLVAYYLCGIPVAAILGFWLQLRGQRLWIGIQVGAFVQSVLLAILTSCQNWEKQAVKARERIFEGRSSADNEQFSVN